MAIILLETHFGMRAPCFAGWLSSLLFCSFFSTAQYNASIRFVRNIGQWPAEVLYRAELSGGYLFVYADSLQFSWYDAAWIAAHKHQHNANERAPESGLRVHSYVIRWKGGNKANVEPHNPASALVIHYYLHSDTAAVRATSQAFEGLWLREIYPGIDLHLRSHAGNVKYEFWVRPGADPKDIRLEYRYTHGLRLQAGQLRIQTIFGEVCEMPPVAYQYKEGKQQRVAVAYRLVKQLVGFQLGSYDPTRLLVIDPELVFSTYSGGFSDNWANTATYDDQGYLYSAGTTYGTQFPNPPGVFTIGSGGTLSIPPLLSDVVVFKYNPTGTQLQYIALIGGNSSEVPHSLVVDTNRDLLILGTTSSPNFPVTDASTFQGGVASNNVLGNNYANGSDLFVMKLSFEGSLKASTLIGGVGNDGLKLFSANTFIHNYGDEFRGDIFVDNTNHIYIASTTRSPSISGVTGSLQGPQDGLLLKLDEALQLLWGYYIGGSGVDVAFSVRQSPITQQIYVAGGTTSLDLPNTSDAYQPQAQGSDDGFVACFSPDGDWLRTTYLGTQSADMVFFVDVDSQGFVYALGQTHGSYPVLGASYAVPNSGQFIHKLTADLQNTIWSTTFGSGSGAPDISLTAFLVNDCGNIYIAGWGGRINRSVNGGVNNNQASTTANLPTTFNAYRRTTYNGDDFYIAVLERDAASLLYATFFGEDLPIEAGDHVDGGTSRFSKNGTIYHAVCASCGGTNGFPTTEGAWSSTNNSPNCNNAAFKFSLDLEAAFDIKNPSDGFVSVLDGSTLCVRRLFFDYQARGAEIFVWEIFNANGQRIFQQADQRDFFYEFTQAGEYTISLTVINLSSCTQVARATKTIQLAFPTYQLSPDTAICLGESVQLQAEGAVAYEWAPSQGLSDPFSSAPLASPAQSTTYYVRMFFAEGCTLTDSVRVEVLPYEPVQILVERLPSCSQTDGIQLKAVGGKDSYHYEWDMGDGNRLIGKTPPPYFYTEAGQYTIQLEVQTESCSIRLQQQISIDATPVPANVITPNDDGINDTWIVEEAGSLVRIYNRWGAVVYKSESYQNDWQGQGLPAGVYYFYYRTPAGRECRGWLHLLR